MKLVKRRISEPDSAANVALERWRKDFQSKAKPNASGGYDMEVDDALLAKLDELKQPGEDYNAVIRRMLDTLPKDGGHRRGKGFRQAPKGKRR